METRGATVLGPVLGLADGSSPATRRRLQNLRTREAGIRVATVNALKLSGYYLYQQV